MNFPGPFPVRLFQDTKLLKRGHAIDPEHDLSGKPHLQFKQLVPVPNGETHDKSKVWRQTGKGRFGGNQCDTPAPIFSVRTSQPETTLQIVALSADTEVVAIGYDLDIAGPAVALPLTDTNGVDDARGHRALNSVDYNPCCERH